MGACLITGFCISAWTAPGVRDEGEGGWATPFDSAVCPGGNGLTTGGDVAAGVADGGVAGGDGRFWFSIVLAASMERCCCSVGDDMWLRVDE